MKIIIGHTSADFDCLASMVAANKLYPDAVAVFPGAIEENVRKFLLLYGNAFNILSLKQIDLLKVTEMIIVDTRQRDRIGPFDSILDQKDLKIHIFDHHPNTDNDIKTDQSIIEKVGSTTTILLKRMIQKNISITYLESTLFALGIYEDTGSLTFSTTTKDDIDVLSFLFSIGVNLRAVNKFTNIGLNIQQKKLLNKLILSSQEYSCKGVNIIFAKSMVEKYIEGLALITHKLIEIINSDIIFVLVQMKNRIYIVSRSRRNSVNVGKILQEIGGGGHSQAASAVVRDISLDDIENKLKEIIIIHIEPEVLAKDIMSCPVKTLDIHTTIEEASKIMLRYGHNGFPVMDKGALMGIITRQEIDKAIHHHYEKETVDIYMSDNIISVNPETPIFEIQELMIKYDVGRVLVLDEKGKLEGIVTRTDLLRSLYGEEGISKNSYSLFESRTGRFDAGKEKIKELIKKYFSRDFLEILQSIGKIGDELGYSVFMVGGIVRDLFLGIPNFDLDVVIEEDAIQFAHLFCRRVKGKIKVHLKFKTAVVILPNGLKIDFASARREFYECPAALPEVEFASIKKDLYRRDFTINSMAIQLNKNRFGRMLDFYGGKRDLELKKIRILYSLSFAEDPARIIRAIRFEQRYNFTMEKTTERFLKKAVNEGLMSKIRKRRLTDELLYILMEKEPIKALKRMDQLSILSGINPNLTLTPNLIEKFEQIEVILKYWYKQFPGKYIQKSVLYLYYLLQLSTLNIKLIEKKIELREKIVKKLFEIIEKKESITKVLGQKILEPSNIYYFLKNISNELILIILLENQENTFIVHRIKKYLIHYSKEKILITGNDLKKIGMKPGPIYAKILKFVFYLQLNGIFEKKDEEIAFIEKMIKKGIV